MKGLSPLVATVMLIAFTVTLATLISGWYTTMTQSTANLVTNKTDIATSCTGASFSVNQLYATAGQNKTARAAVYNSGSVDLKVISAQLFNAAGFNFTANNVPLTLSRGSWSDLSFDSVNISSCPASFSRLIVTTSCANAGAIFDAAPKCL